MRHEQSHIDILTDHDDHRGDGHQDGGHSEGEGVAGVVTEALHVLSQYGSHEGANQRAKVDTEIEEREEGLKVSLLLRQFELVSSKGHDAGFYSSSSNGDQQQSQQREFPRTG